MSETFTDANSHGTTRIKNAIGQVVQVTDAANGNTYYTFDQFGNTLTTKDPASNVITNTYNLRGFKITASDPDMGNWGYSYYSTGELKTQTDAKNQQTTFVYDLTSRPLTRTEPEGVTTWTYGSTISSKNVGKLTSVTSPGGYAENYGYDTVGRPLSATVTIDGTNFVVTNGYNGTTGLLATTTYPTSTSAVPNSRFEVQYDYTHGLLADVRDFNSPSTVYWTNAAMDGAGRITDEAYGNSLHTLSTYDLATGFLQARTTGATSQVQNLSYSWDKVGNVLERKDLALNLTEDLDYDVLNRLGHAKLNSVTQLTMGYDSTGNVATKSDVGGYNYTTQQTGCSYTGLTAQPHAVRNAGGIVYCYDANGNVSQRGGSAISWTSYNLPSVINQGSNSASFYYGAGRGRYKQVSVTASGGSLPAGTETTRYVAGMFEQVTKPSGVVEYKHYIMAGPRAVAVRTLRSNGVNDTRYLHADHLGSVDAVTDESGNVILKTSFSAYGTRRSPTSWTGSPSAADWSNIAATTHRGFTAQEELDNVSLVHMNGRVYDPTIGRFLSADPYVQAPLMSQSLNRYSYAMNAPLALTDPSGFFSLGDLLNPFSHDNPLNPFGKVGQKVGLFAPLLPLAMPVLIDPLGAAGLYYGNRENDRLVVKYPLLADVEIAAACYWGGPWGCAAAQAHYARLQGGDLGQVVVAGALGYVGGRIDAHYGNTFSWERVGVESVYGGVAAAAQGGNFWRGFGISFGISVLQFAAVEMRKVAIADSQNMFSTSFGGQSVGFRGDEIKAAGGWCDELGLCRIEMFGGTQGGDRIINLFGHQFHYGLGSVADYVLEAYAGPHDYLCDVLLFGDGHGFLYHLTGVAYAASEVVAGINIVVATPFVAASVAPVGTLPSIVKGH